MLRFCLMAVCTLVLAACVTVSNTLSPDQVAAFKLTKVDVAFAPDAVVSWGDGEAAYAASRGVAYNPMEPTTPDSLAYQREAIAAKVRGSLEGKLRPRLVGTRPVRVLVTVRNVTISSPLQRILVGGGHSMMGDVSVLDAKTGAVLSTFPGQTATSAGGAGLIQTIVEDAAFDRPIDRVIDNYSVKYDRWLLPS